MQDHLLGIDVGTYSSKAVLTDLAGRVLFTAVQPHGLSMPQPGHVEQDADAVWWHDVGLLSRRLLADSALAPGRIAAMAVSAIGPCLLPLDAAGRPLRPGILYGVDVRATQQIAELEQAIGADTIQAFSRMSLSSQAIGPKIRWLRQQEPAVWQATRHLVSATSYLVWRLTGALTMDRHSASHFMPLYNPATGQWDSTHAAEVAPIGLLPPLGWAEDLAGRLQPEAATHTGLAVGTPVAFGTIDALSEALSVGVTQPGDLMLMHGSTTFFVLQQATPTPDPRVWTVAGATPGSWNLAAGMSTTGSLTRWFKDELARDLPPDEGYAELFARAAEVPPGAGGLLVLPYFSGERTPINDPLASGVVAGLGLGHRREQLFRAVLEGIGFGIRHNLEAFADIGAQVRRVVAVGGGAQTDTGLQIVSDITGVSQEVPGVTVGAAYGDAFLAGRAAGLLQPDDLQRWVRPGRLVQPDADRHAFYSRLYPHFRTLYTATREVVHALKRLG
ncbi:FGGY-family carbohydrate kinase [Aquincola sp. J276]|uniref:FGGY-family carbohydrate kinase n=1 Tax=Aquincola sp. J276 TaxID=2898432 RepID=UPI0021512D22|nr:FGGY-family carbohydrate kinase [Aquincola sp. J276]MCR5867695.1 FGGY-family carbohydrate kinase [Aquincola sp. J276]